MRHHLIASGVLVEGTGERLTRIRSKPAEQWRLDAPAHESAAVEIWCCERERAEELTRHFHARVSPRLRTALDQLALREFSGNPAAFTPREQWLRDAMAPESASQPEALAS